MRKWALVVAIAAALLGAALSIISFSQHMRVQREGFERESFCAISESINCDIVNASSYSEFLNVPISWWGLIFYLLVLGMAVFAVSSGRKRMATVSAAWFMSVGGVIYSAYLACIAFFVLEVVCIECLGMYLANILLLIFLYAALGIPIGRVFSFVMGYIRDVFGKGSDVGFKANAVPHVLIAAVAFFIGWLVIANVQAKDKGRERRVSVDEMVKYYYAQAEYPIEVDPKWAVWGNPDADVTIVEFSEFQCPFCRTAAFNIKPYLQEFKDDVRYFFVNFPLDNACNDRMTHAMHPQACFAARAAICADMKGDFWSFHDSLFRNQAGIGKELVLDLAKKRGWDGDEFMACVESPEVKERLKGELEAGHKIHITGTPTIFLDNRKLRYWRDPKFLREVIRKEIKKSKKRE